MDDFLTQLLEEARESARRRGHSSVEPAHVADALFRRDGERYRRLMGPEAAMVVGGALAAYPGDGADAPQESERTVELLERVSKRSGDRERVIFDELKEAVHAAGIPSQDDESEPEPEQKAAPQAEPEQKSTKPQAEKPGKTKSGKTMSPTPTLKPKAAERDVVAEDETAANDDPGPLKLPLFVGRVASIVEPKDDALGRDKAVSSVVDLLGRRRPGTPCIVGASGSGRSRLVAAVAHKLSQLDPEHPCAGLPIVRVRAEAVVAMDRASTLRTVLNKLKEWEKPHILFLDDIEILGAVGGTGADKDMLGVIRAALGDPKIRLVLSASASHFKRIEVHDDALSSKMKRILLPSMEGEELDRLAEIKVKELEAFHGVSISDEALESAKTPPVVGATRVHPGLLIDRLDAACSRARLEGTKAATRRHVETASFRRPETMTAGKVEAELGELIRGQGEAIARVSRRLALTRAQMDLRPERPDGVFLFVGPTGVGKTALARALAQTLLGSEEALIRLDMSEYAHDWAVARLIGPQPGFVGYGEPEGWLTTKVRERPHCVVLLDEMEKAHQTVWNTFLQVFDAGRLTDGRGHVASFSDAMIIMTSNIGSEIYSSRAIGFGDIADSPETRTQKVIEAVRDRFPPELFNRLDDVIPFQPLATGDITEIARHEIDTVVERFKGRGYRLDVPREVIEFISTTEYDERYGARHLQRNIERMLLEPLVAHEPGRWRATAGEDAVVWVPVAE